MDEQEILLKLRAHVAQQQGSEAPELDAAPPRSETPLPSSNLARHINEVWAAREQVGQLNPRNPGLVNQFVQKFKRMVQRSLSWYTRSLQVFNLSVARAIEEQGTAIIGAERSIANLQRELQKLRSELAAAPLPSRQRRDIGTTETFVESSHSSELAVQEQQSAYVELFRGHSPVLDAGCGRGEFLELLKMTDIAASGVDIDPAVCQAAKAKGLKVVEADLLDHLTSLYDRSLGGIFAARVIEYLPSEQQIEFVALAASKLKPGGVLVIETRNPESTLGFGRTSRLDPTHLRALHPELLKAILESNGFPEVKICTMALAETMVAAQTVPTGAATASTQPTAFATTSPRTQSYAAIAYR